MKTIVMSGPKRSGTTLVNRLFDGHPEIVDMNDEAYFWEHVWDYTDQGCREMFIDIFRNFPTARLYEGFIDRDILPYVEGVYRQSMVGASMEQDLGLDCEAFVRALDGLADKTTVAAIWDHLVAAYAGAMPHDYTGRKGVFIKAADYGKSALAAEREVASFAGLTIIRNPYYAIDSLMQYRATRGVKLLHPFNFGETVRDYLFWWSHLDEMRSRGVLLIRYEDLIGDPEPVMRAVAEHIGISYVPELVEPSLLGEPWSGLSSFSKTRGIDKSALNRPLKVLGAEDLAFIERHLGGVLEAFGYGKDSQIPAREAF